MSAATWTTLEFAVFDFLREFVIGRRDPDCVSLRARLGAEQPEVYTCAIRAGPVPATSLAKQ